MTLSIVITFASSKGGVGKSTACAAIAGENSINRVTVNTSVDPASKAEICRVMLLLREGGGWALSARDKQDATAAVTTVREFLGISE